jgi:hypothetical protein
MVPALVKAVEEARKKIKDIFRERTSERAKIVVEDWKAQNVYPYQGEADTQIERAERQIFDIVAVTVQEATPDFDEIPRPQMALHLRMLRHAIERSPTASTRLDRQHKDATEPVMRAEMKTESNGSMDYASIVLAPSKSFENLCPMYAA